MCSHNTKPHFMHLSSICKQFRNQKRQVVIMAFSSMRKANKGAFHERITQTSWKPQWPNKELHVALSVMMITLDGKQVSLL